MVRAISIWLVCGFGCLGCQTTLLSHLDEGPANDLVVALTEAGIPADKIARGRRFTVTVERRLFAQAWQVAVTRGMPHDAARPTAGLFADDRARRDARRDRRLARLGAVLRADPLILGVRIATGTSGAAVAIHVPHDAPSEPDRASIEAQVRSVLGLGDGAAVAIRIHHAPEIRRVARTPPPIHLWMATGAIVLMLLGGLAAWRRRVSGLFRGTWTAGRPARPR